VKGRAVRPEFGPSLGDVLRARRGVSPRVAVAVFAAVVAVLGLLLATRGPWADPRVEIAHREGTVFRISYPDDVLRRAEPQPGELERLVGVRRRLGLTITVRPFTPRDPVDVAPFGALPLYAHDHVASLRRSLPGFSLREERHLRVNWDPGYDVRFRYGDRMYGRDMIAFPGEDARSGAVMLSLRHRIPRGRAAASAARDDLAEAHRALRSFAFGLE
jgi:hypothetical protein